MADAHADAYYSKYLRTKLNIESFNIPLSQARAGRPRVDGALDEGVLLKHWQTNKEFVQLSPKVRRTRSMLILAIDKRYFRRYFYPGSYAKDGAKYSASYIPETEFIRGRICYFYFDQG